MKRITIYKNEVYVSDDVYAYIKSRERYEERLIERLRDTETLFSNEQELDKLNDYAEENPCEILERREDYLKILNIINTELSNLEQVVLTSVLLNDKKHSDVAKELNLSINQVRHYLSSGIKKIRKKY